MSKTSEIFQASLASLEKRPETPGDQSVPETPEATETPEVPEAKDNPESPEKPQTPETPESPEKPQVNWAEITGGVVKDENEFKSALSQIGEMNKLKAQLKAYDGFDASSLFANDDVKNFNSFVKSTGIANQSVYSMLSNIEDVGSLSKLEAIALAQIIEAPELADQHRELLETLDMEYGISKDKWLEEDENYKPQKNSISLTRDHSLAKKTLQGVLDKMKESSGVDVSERMQQLEALQETWNKAPEYLSSNDLPHKLSDGEFEVDFTVPGKDVSPHVGAISKLFADAGMEANQENANYLARLAYADYFLANQSAILRAFKEKAVAKVKEDLSKEFNNPDLLGDKTKPPKGENELSLAERMLQDRKDREGRK